MRDLEQRIEVFRVYVPEPEDLDMTGMQGRQRIGELGITEEVVMIVLKHATPDFDNNWLREVVKRRANQTINSCFLI